MSIASHVCTDISTFKKKNLNHISAQWFSSVSGVFLLSPQQFQHNWRRTVFVITSADSLPHVRSFRPTRMLLAAHRSSPCALHVHTCWPSRAYLLAHFFSILITLIRSIFAGFRWFFSFFRYTILTFFLHLRPQRWQNEQETKRKDWRLITWLG